MFDFITRMIERSLPKKNIEEAVAASEADPENPVKTAYKNWAKALEVEHEARTVYSRKKTPANHDAWVDASDDLGNALAEYEAQKFLAEERGDYSHMN